MAELTESPVLDDVAAALSEHPEFLGSLISHIAPTGSNTNGQWFRIGDWQVCVASNAIPYGATAGTWMYPQPFAEQPVVIPVPRRGSSPGTFSLRVGAPISNTSAVIERTGGDISVDAVAVGRWR